MRLIQVKKASEETKRKLSEARRGRPMSEAAKEKSRQTQLGRKLPEWHVQKLRDAQKKVWAERRAAYETQQ